jgi:hypothetical protein
MAVRRSTNSTAFVFFGFGSWTAIRRNARMLQTPLPAPRAVGKLGIVMMTDIRGASSTKAKERRWRGAYLFQRRMRDACTSRSGPHAARFYGPSNLD